MYLPRTHFLRRRSRALGIFPACVFIGIFLMALFGCGKKSLTTAEDAAVIERAEELLALYDFDEAYNLLTPHLELLEVGTQEWARALYLHSMAGWQSLPPSRGRVEEARGGFLLLAQTAPGSAFAPMALRNLGRMEELRTHPGDIMNAENARRFYERVLDGWPGSLVAHEAAARLAGTYIQDVLNMESVKKGDALLVDYLSKYPENELAGLMWEYVAETRFLILEDKQGALEALLKADKAGWTDPNKTLTNLWRLANLAEELSELEIAVNTYQRVIAEHTRGGRSWEARNRLLQIKEAHPSLLIEIPETLFMEQ